jgi:hypothetical protein
VRLVELLGRAEVGVGIVLLLLRIGWLGRLLLIPLRCLGGGRRGDRAGTRRASGV